MNTFPQEKYRFALYINTDKKTWQTIQKETGCVALCNLGYYNMSDFTPCAGLVADGRVWAKPAWHQYGLCIDEAGYASCDTEDGRAAAFNYCVAQPPLYVDGKQVNPTVYAKNGVTMVGFTAGGSVTILLAGKDDGLTSVEAVKLMQGAGCVTILRYDGSWSSQGSLGAGLDLQPSQRRIVHNYLLVFEREKKEEDKPLRNGKTVVLDAGHGTQSANKSPDGAYNEAEFALDMAKRMKAILERHGVSVAMTRTGESCPTGKGDEGDLSYRCRAANAISGLDLFVSLHSNAAGSGGWNTARGWSIYTSSAGAAAGRNIAANKIIDRVKEAGIHMRSAPLVHSMLYVLKHTTAPAVLIEHGFHTNKEDTALLKDGAYRQKLAEAQGKGILDYLGVAWNEETGTEAPRDEASPWAKESWEKAVKGGLFDGTSPQGALTREMAAVLLERLNLL